jgi:ATP-binding cassette subfamily C protein LapB
MDHSTEAQVLKELKEFSEDKTLVVVTHRNSLLQLVDRVIVVDGGKIVADGPRDAVVSALRQGRIGKAK